MATTRIKDLSKTATTVASDANIVIDGSSNGTQKITRDNFRQDTADAYVAAPSTYKLAPLNGVNKIDATYLPTSGDTPKGEWNASSNSPALADGAGTAGDYYDVTVAGSQDLGSGSIAYTVGDVVKYDGATWYKIDSVANVLDGSATAADGRTTLEVDSSDEIAESNALKTTAPSMYFNGSSSYLTVADDDKLTFSTLTEFGKTTAGTWSPEDNTPALTDGTGTLNDHYKIDADGTVVQGGSTLSIINGSSVTAGQVVYYDGSVWRVKDCNDLPFTISGWINMTDATNFTIASKYASGSVSEWFFAVNNTDNLRFFLNTSSGNNVSVLSDTALTSYEGQWIHVAATYAGAGPNSDVAFSAADATLYVNGALVPSSKLETGTYAGMSNTTQPVYLGRFGSVYSDGAIKQVTIHNRELSATEIETLFRAGQLGVADQWAGALGGVFTQDSTPSGEFAGVNLTDADEAGPIGGKSNILKLTVNTASSVLHYATFLGAAGTAGKRLRLKCFGYTPSSNSNADGFRVYQSSGSVQQEQSITPDTWVPLEFEFVSNGNSMVVAMLDGASSTFADAGSDDILYLADLTVTEIGTLADFRAENYDNSTGKIYDISDNAFVGTSANLPSLVGREFPVYKTGTWTPTISFGNGSTGITYGAQEGYYTRIGNIVYVTGLVTLTAVGSDTGTAAISGLPFTARNTTNNLQTWSIGLVSNMSGLTASVTALVQKNNVKVNLYDTGATGSTLLTEANFTATSNLRFSGTYQIQ